ncbi:MAG TPA: FixH family protein [Candidatus Salinicoccus merdavium]|nr:FixH family protein [Candidatus Salinicoccus merdavium]
MKIKTLLLAVLASVFLAACGDGSDEEMNHEAPESDEMRTLDVELFTPDHIMAGDTVEMTAHVTSNEEDVTEADHVMFEIQDENEETVEEITAEHSENGEYTVEYTFDEAGTYTVISHVDAFSLHTMPSSEVIVE